MAARTMCDVGVAREDREVPASWREAVARHLEAWAAKQPRRTDRALAAGLGLSNFTYNRLKKKKGPLGLHVLIVLRARLGVTLDDLLGLDPIAESLDDRIRRLLIEHEQEKPTMKDATPATREPRTTRPRRGAHE